MTRGEAGRGPHAIPNAVRAFSRETAVPTPPRTLDAWTYTSV